MMKDEALVTLARQGDRDAFEELVRRFTRLVYARIYLETGRTGGTEDLVQETFVTAWRRLGQLSKPEGFRAWLISIAQNTCIDRFRYESRLKRSGMRADTDPDRLPGPGSEPAGEAERAESREQVLTVLRSMPENYREPIVLRYLLGCDYHTIGHQLGLSHNSLRGTLNRGMAMLREEMKRISSRTG